MHLPITSAWAKLRPRSAPVSWHPLVDHAHDVAAVFEALFACPTIASRLAALAELPELDPLSRARLCVFAFLHDFGKANRGFQIKADPAAPTNRRAGHIVEAAAVFCFGPAWTKGQLDRIDAWVGGSFEACWGVTAAVLAHHGSPPKLDDARAWDRFRALWSPGPAGDPLAIVAGLVDEARRTWPAAFADGPMLPGAPPFWHGVLGLLQAADWLGSDAADDAFRFTREDDGRRRDFARDRASALVAAVGLDVAALRDTSRPAPDFASVSPYAPSPIQIAVGEADGPLVVMEAETGSGKTEAALYRFARLFMAGRVDGLYLALPTRVAATQMHGRVRAAVERLFPHPDRRPATVLALPGDAGADGSRVRRLPDFSAEWSDDPDALERRRRWAAETPKRFLAATVAVGTIDQALLGAVRVEHAQMRAALLARSLLVVDEVHASDAFMTELLVNLLDQHLRAGGEALLLSATLGAAARERLMLRLPRSSDPAYAAATAMPYPAVSTLVGRSIATVPAASRGIEKKIGLVAAPIIDDASAVARLALDAARRGARVLVIRNTVRDAVATRLALEALAPGDPTSFIVAGHPTLHHGRFARRDRRLLDRAVEVSLGKSVVDDRRRGGLIVVGTQTLEISLDIDADLMITDLAPIDVLLQRLGRLHRHDRSRPPLFEAPRAHVLVPLDFGPSLAAARRDRPGGPRGFGPVYDDLAGLEATRRLVVERPLWTIPAMNRELVEAATHSERLEQLAGELAAGDPRWNGVWMQKKGKVSAARNTARRLQLDWDKGVDEFRVDEDAATRLGARDVEVVFDPPRQGPFGPVDRLVVPNHLNRSCAFQPVNIEQKENLFSFKLRETRFLYDRLGLRAAD